MSRLPEWKVVVTVVELVVRDSETDVVDDAVPLVVVWPRTGAARRRATRRKRPDQSTAGRKRGTGMGNLEKRGRRERSGGRKEGWDEREQKG